MPARTGGTAFPTGRVAAAALDLRLVPAAATAWGVTVVALGWSPARSLVVACACAAPVVVLLRRGGGWSHAVALALGIAAVAAALTGIRVHVRNDSPLRTAAGHGAEAVLRLVVRDDPHPIRLRLADGEPAVAVTAKVERATVSGRVWRLGGEVLVFAPASRWRPLLPSQRVVAHGRLARSTADDLAVAVLWARGPPDRVTPPSTLQRIAGRLRSGLKDAAAVLPPAERGLLPGLVLGDTSTLDPMVAEDFRAAGLSHLLAVSGTNLTITVGVVLLLCHRFRLGPWVGAAAGGLALVGFVVVARPSPSVLRAAVMGAVGLLALLAGRPRAGVPALAATVLVLVLTTPDLARSAGFALSVLATGGLLALAPPWTRALRRHGVPVGLAEALAVSAAAHLCTAPVVAALSGQVSLVAVPANVLAAPAVAPATVLGVLATVISPVLPALARAAVWLAGLPTAWLVAVARNASDAGTPPLPWAKGAWAGLWLAVVIVAGLAVLRFRSFRLAALAAAVAALLVVVPTRRMLLPWPPPRWLFVACDVGQGDALVVNVGADSAVVVDTGPDPVGVDRCLHRLEVQRVPLVVLTHLHADHVGGLAGVLRGRKVGAVETGPLREPAWAWDDVREQASAHRIPLLGAHVGDSRVVGYARFDVVGPARAFRGTRSDPNNSSVVLRLTSRGHTVLLTGDVEVDAQRSIEASGVDLAAEVVKVPHHGSSHSDPRFLAATRARVAVISVGAGNDYGHPAPSLVAELAHLGMRVYRTDRDGDIAIYDDAGRLAVAPRGRGP